jgi:hypothetical protein
MADLRRPPNRKSIEHAHVERAIMIFSYRDDKGTMRMCVWTFEIYSTSRLR